MNDRTVDATTSWIFYPDQEINIVNALASEFPSPSLPLLQPPKEEVNPHITKNEHQHTSPIKEIWKDDEELDCLAEAEEESETDEKENRVFPHDEEINGQDPLSERNREVTTLDGWVKTFDTMETASRSRPTVSMTTQSRRTIAINTEDVKKQVWSYVR